MTSVSTLTAKLSNGTNEVPTSDLKFLGFASEMKLAGEEQRVVEGYASTFGNTDRMGDVIDRGAFAVHLDRFKQIPNLFWMHQWDTPVGVVEDIFEDEHGLKFRARIMQGGMGDFVWDLLKQGIVRATSIGFVPHNGFVDEFGVRHLTEIELYEISFVTVPANPEALLTGLKSLPEAQQAAMTKALVFALSLPKPEATVSVSVGEVDGKALGEALTASSQPEEQPTEQPVEQPEDKPMTIDEVLKQFLEDTELLIESATSLVEREDELKSWRSANTRSAGRTEGVIKDAVAACDELRTKLADLLTEPEAPEGDGKSEESEETANTDEDDAELQKELDAILAELKAEKPELFT